MGSHLIIHEGECRYVMKARTVIKAVKHYDDDYKEQVKNFEVEEEKEEAMNIDEEEIDLSATARMGFLGWMNWAEDGNAVDSRDSDNDKMTPLEWMTMIDQSRAEFRL